MHAQRAGALVARAAVTAAATLVFDEVYRDGGWVAPVLAAAAGALVLMALARRLPARWAVAVSVTGMAALAIGVSLGHTTFYGLPTTATLEGVWHTVADGFRDLGNVKPPAATTGGLMFLTVIGVWLISAVAGWLALRTSAPLWALVPPLALHVTLAIINPFGLHGAATFAVVVTAVLYVSVQNALTLPAEWMASEAGAKRRRGSLALSTAAVAVVVATAAVALGPSLPGARAEALIDVGNGNESTDGPRVIVSPLVDLKERLTRTPVVELFKVRSTESAYWRLTSLPTLEKEGWASYLSYRPAKGVLVSELPEPGRSNKVVQEFEIGPMDRFWLPAAYRPSRIRLGGTRVDPETMTLYTRKKSVAGLDYKVESSVPLATPTELGQVQWGDAKALRQYKSIPADYPAEITALAKDITKAAESPYAAAQSILEWLQKGFQYDLTVPPGHSGPRLAQFLLKDKRGFCEQYAAAFAGLARAVGLPSRVAVGWLPGHYEPNSKQYVVTTEETHAWSEVYFEGFGWVSFDPTPGRNGRSPDAEGGPISPNDSGPDPGRRLEGEMSRLDDREASGDTTSAATEYNAGGSGLPDNPEDEQGSGGADSVARKALGWLLIILALIGLVLLMRALLPPLLKRRRRRLRRRAAHTRDRIAGAWWEALDRLREAGTAPALSCTPLEFAGGYGRAAPNHRRDVVEALSALAGLFTRATWGATDPSTEEAESAWAQVDRMTEALDSADSPFGRAMRRLDLSTVRRPGGKARDAEPELAI